MRIKNIAPASIAALTAMAAVLATGTPAQAAATTKFCNMSFEFAGNGCFYSTGDKFTVQDVRADGLRTVLEFQTTDGRSGECHDSNGSNNPPTTCDYDLKENEVAVFYVENRNGATGAPINMGQPITAWTSGR